MRPCAGVSCNSNGTAVDGLIIESSGACSLAGPLPPSLSSLPSLAFVSFGNQFTGTLPPSWGSLASLSVLDVSYNPEITGSIPSDWAGIGLGLDCAAVVATVLASCVKINLFHTRLSNMTVPASFPKCGTMT